MRVKPGRTSELERGRHTTVARVVRRQDRWVDVEAARRLQRHLYRPRREVQVQFEVARGARVAGARQPYEGPGTAVVREQVLSRTQGDQLPKNRLQNLKNTVSQ